MRSILAAVVLLSACTPSLPAKPTATGAASLSVLLAAPKFEPDATYTGADTPEDKVKLTKIVNDAIRDVSAMTEPRDATVVRKRLERAIADVDFFATEDRERAYMYAVRTWRAAGFEDESGLLRAPDAVVLSDG